MKRHRGLRRYYNKLSTENDFDQMTWLNFEDSNTWSKNWHLHFDWYGYGNNSFKRRKPHLDKLFRHFDLLVSNTRNMKSDFQLYVILLDYDSSNDALFLHTPNLNNNQFQFKISELSQTTTLTNKALNEYVNRLVDYEKLYGKADEAFCLLYRKNVGLSFE